MKFSALVETRQKKKDDWVLSDVVEYLVYIPNYKSVDQTVLASAIKNKVESVVKDKKRTVTVCHMFGDTSPTQCEKNQIDYFGEITKTPVVLTLEELEIE